MKASDFFRGQYLEASIYANYRSTASVIDGLKGSGRKVVFTIKKTNLTDKIKVSSLTGKTTDVSNYLHGDASLNGVIVSLAASYTGSNNLPILTPLGSFGSRFTPAAAAPRYIFTKPQFYFDLLFRKEDDVNLKGQMFEGDVVEPVFYIPTLPLLLVNGSQGIGVGFKPVILPRKIENVIKLIKAKIKNEKINPEWLKPYWNGFTGEVTSLGDNSWEIKGVVDSIKKNTAFISEIPISWNLPHYKACLSKLKKDKKIKKYVDKAENDRFIFEITFDETPTVDKVIDTCKLSETITESLVCLDRNNAVREFSSIEEIIDYYYDVKVEFMEKRLVSETKKLEEEVERLKEIFNFIDLVVKGEINLKDKKDSLVKILESKKFKNIDKLLALPVVSLTVEKQEEIKNKWLKKEEELKKFKSLSATDLWLKDIEELEKAIIK